MPRVLSEYDVENNLIDRLLEMRYDYVYLKNYDDVKRNFREQFCRFNAKKLTEAKGKPELSDSEFDRVMVRMEGLQVYEGAKRLRESWVLPLDDGKDVYVDFLSDDSERNIFQVTHQITMDPAHKEDVVYRNRYDVTVFINGLPLVQIELKKPGVEIDQAINQINRYRKYSFKGLFKLIQLFVVSNSTQTKYFANVNEVFPDGSRQDIPKSLAFYWTDEQNVRIPKLMDFASVFLTRFQITELLTRYFVIKQTEPVLMVMRPYQIFAVRECFNRIVISRKNGYVWHCTGSGKTLSSYKLAALLRDHHTIDKVILLIDRKDLDDQTIDEYNSFEKGCVDQTEDTQTLVDDFGDDTKKLIITTIQKLSNAVKLDKYMSLMKEYKNRRVVFIIDECHRSQFGEMHARIEKHFTNANWIGFTGTPIFKENRQGREKITADLFATDTDKMDPCAAKYPIRNAIADGNVLRFNVEFLQTMKKIQLNGQEFGPEMLEDAAWCRKNGINPDDWYHDDRRIAAVADDVLGNLKRHINPQGKDVYTAIFATDRIETLLKYYRYMKDHNPEGYKIAAIFTTKDNADPDEGSGTPEDLEMCMDDYSAMFPGKQYDRTKFDAYRKDIVKRMKQKDEPQIDLLLVVDMFLTGFDSKPTNTLILDKRLVWHSLLQAYSRTNRVDKLTKQFGQIVAYRNIKAAQDDALRLFSGGGNPNDFLLKSYDYYVASYRQHVDSLRAVCPTADEAAFLDNEDDQVKYILAFRNVAHVLATLKTFTKFDWADLATFLDEDEYADYKSWYLTFYDDHKKPGAGGTPSPIDDIDFEIELVRTDRINVVYILNLLKDLNRKDPELMRQGIDQILQEIERSDNEKLRYKKENLKRFVTEKFFEIDPALDITQAYAEFEAECMKADLQKFADENGVGVDVVSDLVTRFMSNSKEITKESIRQDVLDLHLGLLKTTKLINAIIIFMKDMDDKYSVED